MALDQALFLGPGEDRFGCSAFVVGTAAGPRGNGRAAPGLEADRGPATRQSSERSAGSVMNYIRRILVVVLGGTVLLLGLALVVLPGPAFIVIPLGLAILAVEFAWARRWLRSARAMVPKKSKSEPSTRIRRITVQSLRRGIAFLLRRIRRSFLLKRELA
ncbi:MAG: hypothetical protein FJ398_00930 [Verrucomicrobia bacterium]|nr:hypothetical protein [Verrucomicrobiota bacterium]